VRPSWTGPRAAAVGLVAANAVPLVGGVALEWGLHSILVGCWLESAAVCVASVAKIRRTAGEDDPADLPSFEFNDTPVEAFAVARIGTPIGALVVMVLVKTALDLRGRRKEHERARRREPSPA